MKDVKNASNYAHNAQLAIIMNYWFTSVDMQYYINGIESYFPFKIFGGNCCIH